MEIGLQNTIRTVHGTKGADVQNHVAAAGVLPGARALFQERPPVAGQEKDFLGGLNGISGCRQLPIDCRRIIDHDTFEAELGGEYRHVRVFLDIRVYVKF